MPPMRPFRQDKIPRPRVLTEPFALPPRFKHLDIEIGAGVGEFALGYAARNPLRCLVAIEHTQTRYNTFARALAAERAKNPHSLNNLLAVHANAIGWITHALPPESVDRYFILYPNPEPKNAAKRWCNMPFFSRILETLKPGGTVELATNIASYAEEAKQRLEDTWLMKISSYENWEYSSHHSRVRTPFERKYLARGEVCHRICAVKAVDTNCRHH